MLQHLFVMRRSMPKLQEQYNPYNMDKPVSPFLCKNGEATYFGTRNLWNAMVCATQAIKSVCGSQIYCFRYIDLNLGIVNMLICH